MKSKIISAALMAGLFLLSPLVNPTHQALPVLSVFPAPFSFIGGGSVSYSISSDTANVNLRTFANNRGYPGAGDCIISISAAECYSSSATTSAVVVGSWPTGVTVTLIIKPGAFISGAGGSGGNALPPSCAGASHPGQAGGTALDASGVSGFTFKVQNLGTIRGGGGGGGGGVDNSHTFIDSIGGCPPSTITTTYDIGSGGGGGGQGRVGGSGGSGSPSTPSTCGRTTTNGGNGGNGTSSAPGGAGSPGTLSYSQCCTPQSVQGSAAGSGGAWGSVGGGGSGSNTGGAAGHSVTGYANVTWIGATGTLTGPTS